MQQQQQQSGATTITPLFSPYTDGSTFDEAFDGNNIRQPYALFGEGFNDYPRERIHQLQFATDRAQLSAGMTFNLYSEGVENEKILPLDIIPRIIPADDWQIIERGLTQRITALNLFLDDLYNDQRILKDRVVPEEIIRSSPNFLQPCVGLKPPAGIWCHITGTDIIRNSDGRYYVLEDNLRVPSGVSYMLGNRELLKRTFPKVFERLSVRPVSQYPLRLLSLLRGLSQRDNPTVAVLTPGIYNSAYFEHSYLAREMGVELIEGRDLVVTDNTVYMHTTQGLQRVDVIYRRVDDIFLDPQAFRPDSLLGVPGIFEAYKRGNVALVNAPGTGIADDKVVYTYVPRIIKYYLGEDPIIDNIPTYICEEEADRKYVLEHIADLVVKEANGSGGYGMMIGPKSTREEHEEFRRRIEADPRNYIAQPTLSLSTVPTLVDDHIEGRHVDLRPFVLYGRDGIEVVPGGLTRVALKKGSLVVNSSQGGGSKDTWVLY
jgi:uncharacterized circularly permuted ATP-grasp superfamily protein